MNLILANINCLLKCEYSVDNKTTKANT